MCVISVIIGLVATATVYHILTSPSLFLQPLPQITTTIQQPLLPNQPLVVRDPLNLSRWIRIDSLEQGEIYQLPVKRYVWRNILLRPVKK